MSRTKFILALSFLVFIFGYGLGFTGNQWYLQYGNTYFHFLGGICAGLLVASYYANQFDKLPQLLRFFCIVGMTIGVGLLWEFHEYLLSETVSRSFQGDLKDTMLDLFMDTIGGVVAALYPMRSKSDLQP